MKNKKQICIRTLILTPFMSTAKRIHNFLHTHFYFNFIPSVRSILRDSFIKKVILMGSLLFVEKLLSFICTNVLLSILHFFLVWPRLNLIGQISLREMHKTPLKLMNFFGCNNNNEFPFYPI